MTRAYAVLSNPERRKRYDETGSVDDDSIRNAQQRMVNLIGIRRLLQAIPA